MWPLLCELAHVVMVKRHQLASDDFRHGALALESRVDWFVQSRRYKRGIQTQELVGPSEPSFRVQATLLVLKNEHLLAPKDLPEPIELFVIEAPGEGAGA